MTTAEIVSTSIAGISFILSVIALYIGQLNGFKGRAYPANQIVLSWDLLNGDFSPNLIMPIEYINKGAKVGKIDTLALHLCDDNGGVIAFKPLLVFPDGVDLVPDYPDIDDSTADKKVDQVSIGSTALALNGMEISGESRQCMNVWIAPRSYKQETVLFHSVADFTLKGSTRYKLKLSYCTVKEANWFRHIFEKGYKPTISWKTSKVICHYTLQSRDYDSWSKDRKTIAVISDEVSDSWKVYQDKK